MKNQIRMTNVEGNGRRALCSDFEGSGFFRHSSFVIQTGLAARVSRIKLRT
jgi:hypothetical protein